MESTVPLDVETQLNGFFRPDFRSEEKVVIDVTGKTPTTGYLPPTSLVVHDARELQRKEDDGSKDFESKFFQKHGFVLISHKSAVNNWDSGAFGPADALSLGDQVDRHVSTYEGENEIASRYLPEVDDLIRSKILPHKRLEIDQPEQVLRRGKNTAHPFFGLNVHNDYGVSADDFEENTAAFGELTAGQAWRDSFERDEVAGFMVINFWRTVHMSEPLTHLPLAILDAASVNREDLVSSGLKGFTYTGRVTNQLHIRYNDAQRWYYYPEMSVDEVLVLSLFHCFKNDQRSDFHQCFHSAFENPLAPPDAEERQSCEHRVNVHILRD